MGTHVRIHRGHQGLSPRLQSPMMTILPAGLLRLHHLSLVRDACTRELYVKLAGICNAVRFLRARFFRAISMV